MSCGGPVLVSTELECPVVSLRDGRPPAPEVFQSVWQALAADGWRRGEFGVERERRLVPRELCINAAQAITTDTGPTIEFVPSPAHTLAGVARQIETLMAKAGELLADLGYAMLGAGLHPSLRARPADYYAFRTPRPSYDYVVDQRGWHHWSILNCAAAQEIVDVSFDDAPRALRLLHRLAGLMNFVLRNDPDLLGDYDGQLSVRPRAWREHVPASARFAADATRVFIPEREILTWTDYASLLWDTSPMFPVGTKNRGVAYLPEHPTFIRFLREAPADGWPARTLTGETVRVAPEPAHLEKSDWTYLGFARVRWKWRRESVDVAAFLDAWSRGDIETFLRESVEKVVIENRSNSTQPPGETLASLPLVAGLMANLDEAQELTLSESYAFWRAVLVASLTEPLDAAVGGRSVPELARRMVDIARRGLVMRGEPSPEGLLAPLYRRIEERRSPAEHLLREYRRGGLGAVIDRSRLSTGGGSSG